MATISFDAEFNLKLSPKQFFFKDTSDYAGQGINPNNITGSFKVTFGGNVIYNNLANYQSGTLADIILSSSNTNATIIQLPLNPDGTVPQGLYTVYYQVWDSGSSTMSSVTETFNFIYASPSVEVAGSVQVYTPSPLLTLTDNTVYIVNSVTPTLNRVATITYPPILINNVLTTPTPTTGTTAVTTSTTFYTPTQVTMSVVSNLTYTFSNFQVVDKVSGEIPFQIDATSFCKLYCGLLQMQINAQNNPQNSQLQDDCAYAGFLVVLIMLAQNCGKTDDISSLITQIENLGSFDTDCGCGCGSSVQQVIGLGSLVNAYNVLSANSYITVTPVTSGNTTTFTIQLADSLVAQINAILGATLVAGDNIVLTSTTVNQNTTWTINADSATVTSNNGSIAVIAATASHTTNYDLSLVEYNTTKITDTTLQAGSGRSGDNALFTTGLQPSAAGTYLCLFDADLYLDSAQQIVGVYYPYKVGTPASNINVGASVGHADWDSSSSGVTGIKKISSVTTIVINARDVVNINLNVSVMSPTTVVKNANLTLIKIA